AILIATAPDLPIQVSASDPSGKKVAFSTPAQAPSQPGFLTISQNKSPLLRAAVHFADTREADLSACAPTEVNNISNRSSMELHTTPDPLWRLWLLILLATLLIAWHFTSSKPILA
ncbi:MAG: hypothetical protein H7Y36_06925, partial [Armatimonadetes bacterium]|nr:hypothetical protein [Akkermansiaceae bacterium]